MLVQSGWSGCRTGSGEKLSNSQLSCLAQLCLVTALFLFCFLCDIHSIHSVLKLSSKTLVGYLIIDQYHSFVYRAALQQDHFLRQIDPRGGLVQGDKRISQKTAL